MGPEKETLVQGRNQGRCQPAPGHPLSSLKNKGRTVKINFLLTRIFYFLNRAPPIDHFWFRPCLSLYLGKFSQNFCEIIHHFQHGLFGLFELIGLKCEFSQVWF
jgi:hypothetical protein